jgi:hypothetical protein
MCIFSLVDHPEQRKSFKFSAANPDPSVRKSAGNGRKSLKSQCDQIEYVDLLGLNSCISILIFKKGCVTLEEPYSLFYFSY